MRMLGCSCHVHIDRLPASCSSTSGSSLQVAQCTQPHLACIRVGSEYRRSTRQSGDVSFCRKLMLALSVKIILQKLFICAPLLAAQCLFACWLCCKAQEERTREEWSKPYPYARPFPLFRKYSATQEQLGVIPGEELFPRRNRLYIIELG